MLVGVGVGGRRLGWCRRRGRRIGRRRRLGGRSSASASRVGGVGRRRSSPSAYWSASASPSEYWSVSASRSALVVGVRRRIGRCRRLRGGVRRRRRQLVCSSVGVTVGVLVGVGVVVGRVRRRRRHRWRVGRRHRRIGRRRCWRDGRIGRCYSRSSGRRFGVLVGVGVGGTGVLVGTSVGVAVGGTGVSWARARVLVGTCRGRRGGRSSRDQDVVERGSGEQRVVVTGDPADVHGIGRRDRDLRHLSPCISVGGLVALQLIALSDQPQPTWRTDPDPPWLDMKAPSLTRYWSATPFPPVIWIIACRDEGPRLWRIMGPLWPIHPCSADP